MLQISRFQSRFQDFNPDFKILIKISRLSSRKLVKSKTGLVPVTTEPVLTNVPATTEGVQTEVPVPTDGVPVPTDGVPVPTDGVLVPTDGVLVPTDGVPITTEGVPTKISDTTDELPARVSVLMAKAVCLCRTLNK